MAKVGTGSTRLIVLRGNSASGKSAVANRVRERAGRGIAIVGQDLMRRQVLWEKDAPDGLNIGLIDTVARYALDYGYHVIIEGILKSHRYGAMLQSLRDDHRGHSSFFYWDLSFEETLRRHATKPQATEYGEVEMRPWFRAGDLLPFVTETIVTESSTLDESVDLVIASSGLADNAPALHP
jgi:predicted kinase